nr:hypothetical protein [Tanacetum cinerariifolium]
MRLEECAPWDGSNSTWGGRGVAFGIVPVCVRVQERAGEEGLILAGRCSRPMRFESLSSWDLDKLTWEGRVEAEGAVPLVQGIVHQCWQQDDIRNGVHVQAVAAADDSLAIPKHTIVETPMNMSPAKKAHFEAEKEAIHLILTGIGDDIYSTVDACQTAQEMFVMIVNQQHKLDEVSYQKLFDILKQYQKEVNELRAERLARNANPLALVATGQANQDPYYQTSKSRKSHAPSSKPSIPTRSHTTTRHKGKEIAKLSTSQSETASKEDNNPEQAQRDKDITSSNSRNKNVDTTLRYKNDNQSGQFGNQRTVNVAGARENVGSPEVQQSGIQSEQGVPLQAEQYDWLADTDEEIDDQELEAHYSYMTKIQEVPTADSGTNFEPLEQVQNDAGYNVFANDLQHYEQSDSISNTCLVETDDSNVIPDSSDMYEDDIQNDKNDVESDDERVALANLITNLIANLKLDVDANKKIQKQLKKANTTFAQELKECKTIFAETSNALGESISVRDSCRVALQTKQTGFEKYKAFNDRTVDYDKLERELNKTLGQLAQKDIEIKKDLKTKAYEILVVKEKHDELIKQSLLTKSHYECLVKQKTKEFKPEMHANLKYIESLEREIYKLESDKIVQLILFIVDSGCTKHMTGNLKLLCNFVEKFLDVHVSSQQELDLLFGPLYDECFNAGSNPQDKQPITNIQPTSTPSTPIYVHAEKNNDDQACNTPKMGRNEIRV